MRDAFKLELSFIYEKLLAVIIYKSYVMNFASFVEHLTLKEHNYNKIRVVREKTITLHTPLPPL